MGCSQRFSTVHNYIDHDSNMIRKGAVSAKKGEKLLIPINMRDGSLLCVGRGMRIGTRHPSGRMSDGIQGYGRHREQHIAHGRDH